MNSPRILAQVITVIATFFTASVRWALGGSATILAQKHFHNKYHPIFEIEHFSALRNITVIWDWTHRRRMMFLTWFLVAMCGLLTSGFVALIAPFPISIYDDLSGYRELDFTATSPSCLEWYSRARERLFYKVDDPGAIGCHPMLNYKGFLYSTCIADTEAFQGARAAILGTFGSTVPPMNVSNFVSTFATLDNSRIFGSTAGTLPLGPNGVDVFNFPPRPPSQYFNYTLSLQGFWPNVECEYNKNPASNFTLRQADNNTQMLNYTINCPNGQRARPPPEPFPVGYIRNRLLITYYCSSPAQNHATLYLRSANTTGDPSNDQPTVYTSPQDPMDYIECRITPRAGNVTARVYSHIKAFRMLKGPAEDVMTNFSRPLFQETMFSVASSINYAQSKWGGNTWVSMVRWLAISHEKHEDWTKPDPKIPKLVARAIQGMFEYEVTRMRLALTATADSGVPVPSECTREVTGRLIQSVIGWNLQPSMLWALLPLLIISLISTYMLGRALLCGGGLTRFDPTSPVSLVAATSAGEVRFTDGEDAQPHVAVGDTLDTVVGRTKVAYGKQDGVWGLRSE